MAPKKGQGKAKGKQPARRAAPAISPNESSDEEAWPIWAQLQARMEALEGQRGIPPQPAENLGGGRVSARPSKARKRARLRELASTLMARFDVLEQQGATTAADEAEGAAAEAGGDVGAVAVSTVATPVRQQASGSGIAVGGPSAASCELAVAPDTTHLGQWPWGTLGPQEVGQVGAWSPAWGSPSTITGGTSSQGGSALGTGSGMSAGPLPGIPTTHLRQPGGGGGAGASVTSGQGMIVRPAMGGELAQGVMPGQLGACSWGGVQWTGPAPMTSSPGPGFAPQGEPVWGVGPMYAGVPYAALPHADYASPLGEHLAQATKEKIWRGDYMDLFSLLNRELDSRELEKEDPRDKERRLRKRPERSWANWLPAYAIYMSVVLQAHPWRAQSMIKYMDIIYKAYTDFPGHAWLCYDEKFRMKAAVQPHLRWDEPMAALWLMTMTPVRPALGERFDSGHIIRRQAPVTAARVMAGQQVQPRLVCWDYNGGGTCSRRPCRFRHECSVCGAQHPAASCNKAKGPGARQGEGGANRKSAGGGTPPTPKGPQPNQG